MRRPGDRRLEPAFDGLSLALDRFYSVIRELGPKQRVRNGSRGIRAREEQVHNEIVDEEQQQKHQQDTAGRNGCLSSRAVAGRGTRRSCISNMERQGCIIASSAFEASVQMEIRRSVWGDIR